MTQDSYLDNEDNSRSLLAQDNENELATDETSATISSRKVEGTAVYGKDGDRLGSIQNFMVNKVSGQVEYAVLEFGGIFGFGGDHYPIPWNQLRYSTEKGGYMVNLDRKALENGPHYDTSFDEGFNTDRSREVDTYYGTIVGM